MCALVLSDSLMSTAAGIFLYPARPVLYGGFWRSSDMTLLGQKPLDQMPCTARSVAKVAALGFPSPMVSVDVKQDFEGEGLF